MCCVTHGEWPPGPIHLGMKAMWRFLWLNVDVPIAGTSAAMSLDKAGQREAPDLA